jgi:RecB family endonuclease NucS
MRLISTQYKADDSVIDILAEDVNGTKCIIEVKVGHDERIVFQSMHYPRLFNEPTRMITMCPSYTTKIKNALKSIGCVELMKFEIVDGAITVTAA